jgi:hypothetical protein
MGRRKSFLRSKDKAYLPCCQASGRDVQFIHRRESLDQRDTAGLTAKGLDALGTAMLAITDESMDGGVCDP